MLPGVSDINLIIRTHYENIRELTTMDNRIPVYYWGHGGHSQSVVNVDRSDHGNIYRALEEKIHHGNIYRKIR